MKVVSAKLRYLSLVVDFLLFNDFMVVLTLAIWMFTPLNNVYALLGGKDLYEGLGKAVYALLFVAFYFTKGLSPANALLSFRIQEVGGGKQGFKTKLVRLVFASVLFSFMTIPFDAKRKGFHDMVSGTEVLSGKASLKKIVLLLLVVAGIYLLPFLF